MSNTTMLLPAGQGLAAAAKALAAARLVVMPTDTVYGIAARPDMPAAVSALFAAKARPRAMPVPVLVAGAAQVAPIALISKAAQGLMDRFWPGAMTLVLPMRPGLGWDLGQGDSTVALRQPDHKLALELLEATGPLAVTSANLSGRPPALEAWAAQADLGLTVAVYLDDGPSPGAVPSTVVRLVGEDVKVIRDGAISRADIVRAGRREVRSKA